MSAPSATAWAAEIIGTCDSRGTPTGVAYWVPQLRRTIRAGAPRLANARGRMGDHPRAHQDRVGALQALDKGPWMLEPGPGPVVEPVVDRHDDGVRAPVEEPAHADVFACRH